MSRITIVMGIAAAGKSYFIKNNFSNDKIIDLWDFQKDLFYYSYENILKSYEQAKDAFIEAIKNNEDVVLEHTLLKAKRRKYYIDEIRRVTDAPINIYVMLPNIDKLKEYRKKRDLNTSEADILEELHVLEIPKKEEGFENVYIIE